MRVLAVHFNDVDSPESWEPPDSLNFAEWISVIVGESAKAGGTNYEIHICTPRSIKNISDKTACFMIQEWKGVSDLVGKLDEFIAQQVDDPSQRIDLILAKQWRWEYEGM